MLALSYPVVVYLRDSGGKMEMVPLRYQTSCKKKKKKKDTWVAGQACYISLLENLNGTDSKKTAESFKKKK